MSIQDTEKKIDELLIFMNAEVESHGLGLNLVRFDFAEGHEDAKAFCDGRNCTIDELHRILNICNTRGYVDCKVMGPPKHNHLNLTTKGQGRALSSMLGGERTTAPDPQMHIGTLNVTGPTQVGNGNIQNFDAFFNEIIKRIDSAEASDEYKAEAKSHLQRFLEHPLTTAIAGGAAGGIAGVLTSLTGGGK